MASPITRLVPFLSALGLMGCTAMGDAAVPGSSGAWMPAGSATLVNASGAVIGTAQLQRNAANWRVGIGVSGLTPGDHGIHLHEVGRCDAPDFASAKGHLNPAGKSHGSANPAGMHMGDLPNLTAAADGTASTFVPLPAGLDPAALFDADGTAIVIHAGADDYKTDPSGNSGGRVACGIVSAQP